MPVPFSCHPSSEPSIPAPAAAAAARMSPVRPAVAALLALVATLGVPSVVWAAPCWRPPVTAPIVDPFRAPECRWCAGNRGIEYGTHVGQPVRAVESGRVTYAGAVAGRIFVVVEHADGLRTTYGDLDERAVARGDVVVRGQRVGTAGTSLHFGVRRGEEYLDPTPMLGRLVGRPRLIPGDGSPGPVVAAQWRCGR